MTLFYRCPLCNNELNQRCLPHSVECPDGTVEVFLKYQLECEFCGVFANSICNCDGCTVESHFDQCYNSLEDRMVTLRNLFVSADYENKISEGVFYE